MSNENENDNNNSLSEKIFLLTNIFESMPNMPSKILPLLSSSNEIKTFYSFINYNNNNTAKNNTSIKEKLGLLEILTKLFQMNNNLIFLFLKKCKSNIKSFFDPLIDIYLNENTKSLTDKKIIEDLLLLILKNVSVNKNIFDYIYQKLSKYFGKDVKIKLRNEIFLKYLNLFDIFYNCSLSDDKNENNNEEKKEIKNFFYFNGIKNKLSLTLNKTSNNINSDFPTLENGFSFITWIKIEKTLIDSYFLVHKNDDNSFVKLININFGGHNIKLLLADANNIILLIDDMTRSNYINISNNFKYNEWNSIAFIFYSKKSTLSSLIKTTTFKLFINQHMFNFYIDLKNLVNHLDKKIDSISFFENLIGKSTSVLYFSYSLDEEKLISLFNSIKETGLYKVKYLYRFLLSNDKDYSKYSKSNIYNDNYKINFNKIIDINSKEQNIKNLMCFLCPFSYNSKNNTVDDIFGNFIGVISPESGVNFFINNFKNIENLGGIDNLLPIAELMLLTQNKKEKSFFSDKDFINYDLLEENSLDKNTFLKYMTIIKKIINGKKLNLLDSNKHKFFSSLELFLEKFPPHIFTEQILDIFLQIGKETFGSEDDIEENFVNMILLNEKIFSKFSVEVQQKLWEGVHAFFTSDYLQMKESIPMSKICLLLRFYDSKRYDKFCCKKHADLFKSNKKEKNENEINNEQNVMNPDMNTTVNKLFETIQLYLEKFPDEEDNDNLFKLLTLDLSPCLQIKIIRAYINFFNNKKRKDGNLKSKVIKNLLKYNLFDIYEYVLSVSLLDVKVELIEFLKLLMKKYDKEIEEYCTKKHFKISKFFEFVGYHLIPSDLKVEINESKTEHENEENNNKIEDNNITKNTKEENKKEIPNYIYNILNTKKEILLVNYFNKEIYEKDIESMWKVLNEWLIENDNKNEFNISNEISHLKLNSYVLSFCISFVSKLNPFYIDSLLIIVYSFLKNSAIVNKDDLYNNELFFPWIIETIFFFYDAKNLEYFKDIDIIQLIQQHSIELFKEFISCKRTNSQNEVLINYIFDFAFHLKSNGNNDETNLNKLGSIIRLILSQILEHSKWNINLITKFCIQFMIFFKNSEKLYNNKELIDSFISLDDNNLYKSLMKKESSKNTLKRSNKISENQSSSSTAFDYIYNEEDENKESKNKNEFQSNETDNLNKKSSSMKKYNYFIPEYIYKSLFLNKDKTNADKSTLIQIWKDFDLFNFIINYYQTNLWGTSYLCKKIKLNYKGNVLKISKELIKEYSSNSKYKNILLKELRRCLNFAQEEMNLQKIKERIKNKKNFNKLNREYIQKTSNNIKINIDETENRNKFKLEENVRDDKIRSKTREKVIKIKKDKKKDKHKDKVRDKSCDVIRGKNPIKENLEKIEEKNEDNVCDINILKINILLLSIGIEITMNEKEKIFLINKYEQFLLFCIICSLNINQTETFHEFVKSNLFDLIGYGLLFLKKKHEEKFKEFINTVMIPFFDEIFIEKSKIIKNIFSYSKFEVYQNSALYELFILGDEIKDKNLVNSSNLTDILISRTKIGRISSMMENNLNNLIYPILNENKDDIDEMNEKTRMICEVIYEQKNKDTKNQFVMFVCDSMRIKKHVINAIVIYYLSEKRKKYLMKKSKVSFKSIEDKEKNGLTYFDMQFFYNINNKSKNSQDKKIQYEKLRLSNSINSLIPFFENQIKKYSNSSVLQDKKRRNIYKLNKKKLFSWNEFWSNRDLFYKHPELLKCKIKNHLTKDMTKIILTPILDFEYYMPEFSKFESKKLFNEGDHKYKVNLDIEEILREKNIKKEEEKTINKEIINKSNNDLKFNYLECIYKLSYEDLWEKYKNYNEQKFNFENNTIANITRNMSVASVCEFYQNQFSLNSIHDDKTEFVFNCCLVKLTHHIMGMLRLEKDNIKFIFNLDENKENIDKEYDDPTFDKDLGTCFGSTFKCKKSDKDKISLDIPYDKIKYLFMRYYYYQETGLEIYTTTNKNYYFNFKSNFDLMRAKSELLRISNYKEIKGDDFKGKGKKVLGYEKISNNDKKKAYLVNDKMKEWRKYKISTLEYLMWMNIYGGRSLNDLTQYPVFPWLITDYITDELTEDNDNNLRNLFLPMGMIEINENSITRKETFIETYDLIKNELKENFSDFNYNEYLKKGDEYYDYYQNKKLKQSENTPQSDIDGGDNSAVVELNQLPSFYGSHYSNPTYVTHYLARIFPFAFVSIEIQGDKFDDPNRMFISISRTFESASTTKDDIRELIPEFYLLPEMFQNCNNLNLAQGKTDADNNKIIINDVDLPSWCNEDPNNFISEKRKFLEKSDLKINKWIDIIFGNYQRGEKAEEIHNIFKAQSYEKMVKIDNIKDIDMRNALMRLVEVGITPMQILDTESKPKVEKKIFLSTNSVYSKSKGKTLDEAENLISVIIDSQKYENFCSKNYENSKLTYNKDYKQIIDPKITKILYINQKLLKIFINNDYYYNINIQNFETKGTIEESHLIKLENNSSKYAPSYKISNNSKSFIINKKDNYILKSGFWDNRIEYNTIPSSTKEESNMKIFYPTNRGPITIMEYLEEENILVCGTKLGYILYYNDININTNFEEPIAINAHSDEIISISINDTLHLCATSSVDGYIMIFTLPEFCLVRSIQTSKKVSDADISEEEFIFADNIFLSSSPIPCLITFISIKQLFTIYNINGKYIGEVEESEDTKRLNSPIIFKNLEFQDFLIYGTDDGYIKIRSFPNMQIINMIKPFEGQEIKTLEISHDKRYCFAWSYGNKIVIVKDSTVAGVDIKEKDNKEKKVNEQNEEDLEIN